MAYDIRGEFTLTLGGHMSFLMQYGNTILYTILTAIIGYAGVEIKKHIVRWVNLFEKKEVVKTCVIATNRIYSDKSSKEKYDIAVKNIRLMLSERNIEIGDLETKMLIAEVCETIDCNDISPKLHN